LYILVVVADDVYFPNYISGSGNAYQYDHLELYFDVNYDLEDGGGYNTPGHYQIAPDFAENLENGTATTRDDGVVYAFMINNPGYLAEYFIPFSKLKDNDGLSFDKTGILGFDVTVIDRDALDIDGGARNRAVWANDGTGENGTESYYNCDAIGWLYLDACCPCPCLFLAIEPLAPSIATDNGTVQFSAIEYPFETVYDNVLWSVENLTGRAKINQEGFLTAISNGTVKVICQATDGSFLEDETIVTISNQVVYAEEVNLIKNGNFNDVTANGQGVEWDWETYDSPAHQIIEGVSVHTPVGAASISQYSFNQSGFKATPNIDYELSFYAWADEARPVTVSFEDTEANGFRKYGTSTDPRAEESRSQWNFEVTTEPTKYSFHVNFDEILPSTIEKLNFMLGTSSVVTYIDSIMLLSQADIDMIATSVPDEKIANNEIKLYPVPATNILNISVTIANSTIAVYNSVGQKIDEVVANGNKASINVSSYAKGLYLIKVGNKVVKFVR
jgi:hypothetical protein